MTGHILVVGAGIIGATTALSLAEQGFKVTIIDRANALGQGASGLNGGQLSYSYTDALASPETLKSLPKYLFGLDDSFRMSLSLSPDFLRWGFRFLANCRQRESDLNTIDVLKLAASSQRQMTEWLEKYDFKFSHSRAQKLHLYESARDLEKAKRRVELKNQFGARQSILDHHQVLELEPALEKMNANLAGAVHSPYDEVGDVVAFTKSAIDKSLSLGGGEIVLDTELNDILIEQGRYRCAHTSSGEITADYLVICTGYESTALLKKIGIKSRPIVPVAGYSLTYPAVDDSPSVSLTDTAKKMVLCKLGSSLRIAGMADLGTIASKPPVKRLELLKRTVQTRFPYAADYLATATTWAGMRPMTSNSQPLIELSHIPNVVINSGHGMLGWTLAAGAAKATQELIVNQANSL